MSRSLEEDDAPVGGPDPAPDAVVVSDPDEGSGSTGGGGEARRRRNGSERQPVFNVPTPVLVILGSLLLIHLLRQVIPEAWDDTIFPRLAFVPGRLTFWFDRAPVIANMMTLAGEGADGYRQAAAGRFFLGDGSPQPWTMVTYALLHADWTHVGLNSIWLLAFGTPVARRLSVTGFVLFFAMAAVAGAIVHEMAHPLDLTPVIGASAAVSGTMGATLRFMFQPHMRMPSLVGAGSEAGRQAALQPLQPLRHVLTDRRAVTFLLAWFGTNLLFGLGSTSFGLASGPIAWEAHIGGFLAGLLAYPWFDPGPRGAASPPLEPEA